MAPRIWLIAGPTASGKSALALRLALATGGEVVNADSMQLYADLRLVTACTSIGRGGGPDAPHRLFGTVDAADGWLWWAAGCAPPRPSLRRDRRPRGRSAIVVGGTGLYFRALTQGLAEIPQVPAEVRRQAQADYDMMGESSFRGRLGAYDPTAALRIAPGDRQRLVRAWEVFAATDTPLTDWQSTGEPALAPGTWRGVALEPPRQALYARCDARLAAMVEAGALEEVFTARPGRPEPSTLRCPS